MRAKTQRLLVITIVAIELLGAISNLTSAETTLDPKIEYYLAKQDWDSLVKVGQPAIPRLIAAMSDQDERVRVGSAKTLVKLGYVPEAIDEKVTLYTMAQSKEELLKIGPSATSPLCTLLRRLNNDGRWERHEQDEAVFIVETLAKIGDRDAVDALIAVSDGRDYRSSGYSNVAPSYPVTEAAVESLGELGRTSTFSVNDIEDLRSLAAKLIDKSDEVSKVLSEQLDRAATDALARYQGSNQMAPDLESLLVGNLNKIVAGKLIWRGNSGFAITRFKSVSLRPETIRLYECVGADRNSCARLNRLFLEDAYPMELARSSELSDPKVIDHLIWLLDSKTCGAIWKACAVALAKLGDARAAGPLGEALVQPRRRWGYDTDYRASVSSALVCIGTPSVDPLIDALKNKEADVRRLASSALGKIGDKRAFPPLSELLKDGEASVRLAVVDALGKLGDQQAILPLIGVLKDQDSRVRKSAAEALDRLGWKP